MIDYPKIINELDEYGDSQDPRVEHSVLRECTTCFRYMNDRGGWIFNKNTGTMHIQHFDFCEKTKCGIDATHEQYLWQM